MSDVVHLAKNNCRPPRSGGRRLSEMPRSRRRVRARRGRACQAADGNQTPMEIEMSKKSRGSMSDTVVGMTASTDVGAPEQYASRTTSLYWSGERLTVLFEDIRAVVRNGETDNWLVVTSTYDGTIAVMGMDAGLSLRAAWERWLDASDGVRRNGLNAAED